MTPLRAEQHFPWYVDATDTDNIDCQCGTPCNGIGAWATHITNQLTHKGDNMNDVDHFSTTIAAAKHFITTWAASENGPHLANDIADKLRCDEVEALAGLLEALGQQESAKQWIIAHSVSDDCDDQHCTCKNCNVAGALT